MNKKQKQKQPIMRYKRERYNEVLYRIILRGRDLILLSPFA